MNIYVFKGIVYPEKVDFTLSGLSSRYKDLSFSSPDWNIEGAFDISVENSRAIITLKSKTNYNFDSNPNIETVKNIIERISRLFIDTYCFVHSYNYDLIIDSVECEKTGLKYTFSVKGEIGFAGDNKNYVKYLDIILKKQTNAFGDAFADYRRSIKYPDTTAAYCLRALESIRRACFDNPKIEDNNKRDKDGWENMSKEIGVDSNTSFKLIQQFATPNRHGVYPAINWDKRKKIMKFTREVIKKSLDWLAKN